MKRLSRDDDRATRILAFLDGKIDKTDLQRVEDMLLGEAADADPDPSELWPNKLGAEDRRPTYAMDSSDAFTRMRDLRSAERVVAPHVGEVLGQDSAAGVFREALRRLGYDGPRQHPSALPEVFRLRTQMSHTSSGQPLPPRRDPVAARDFARALPEAARIRVL